MTVISIGSEYLNMNSDCDYHIESKSRSGGLEVGMRLSDFCELRCSIQQKFVLYSRTQDLKPKLVMETTGILGSQTVSNPDIAAFTYCILLMCGA